MKTLIYLLSVLACTTILKPAFGQKQICVWCGYNVSQQPVWGPTGYSNANYYYLPDIEVYYDVNAKAFIYQKNGVWKVNKKLPLKYAGFNLYSAYKVVINEDKPYLHHKLNVIEYAWLKGRRNEQQVIRDSCDPRYFEIVEHPEYNRFRATMAAGRRTDQLKGRNPDCKEDAKQKDTAAK